MHLISLQPLISDSLEDHCKKAINGELMEAASPNAQRAVRLALKKLGKCKSHLWSPLAALAQALGPRVASEPEKALSMKTELREALKKEYDFCGKPQQPPDAEAAPRAGRGLLTAAQEARGEGSDEEGDEVDVFCYLTEHGGFEQEYRLVMGLNWRNATPKAEFSC